MDASLVREGAESCNGVVERNVDLDCFGDQIFDLEDVSITGLFRATPLLRHTDLLDHAELVFALDVIGTRHHHTGHKSTERGDAVTFADAKNTGIDVGGACLQRAEAGRYKQVRQRSRGKIGVLPVELRTRWRRCIRYRRGNESRYRKLGFPC